MGSSFCNFISMGMFFLFSLFKLFILTHSSSSPMQPLCHEDERLALLQFKDSFIINKSVSDDPLAYPKVVSWTLEGDGASDCCSSWDGVECDEKTGHVIGLDLGSSCLFGSINSNSSLFRLVHLQRLNLSHNQFNYSHIPFTVGNLSRLKYLDLSFSVFSGQIPLQVSLLSQLSSLKLCCNYDLSSGQNLLELKKPSLKSLVGNLAHLEILDLGGVNVLSRVPSILAKFSSLTDISLHDCGLRGEFPIDIFKKPNLRVLDVKHNRNLTGYLPDFQWSSPLELLTVAVTSFSGELPVSIGNLGSLSALDMSFCNFSGSIPSSLGNLTNLFYLMLSANSFRGHIPLSIGNLIQLTYLDLGQNQLTGSIPFGLMNLTQLTDLVLNDNQLSGPIPSRLMNLTQLTILVLERNRLTSLLPFGPVNVTQLEFLDLAANELHGPIPRSVFDLKNLEFIDLSHNFFTSIGEHSILLPLSRLVNLDLSANMLQGSLPIPPFSTLRYHISNNSLSGEIPKLVCNASSLQVLDLSDNNLRGSLPQCFRNFSSSLSVLDMAKNKFEGSIPQSWTKGSKLRMISLSQNKFDGQLPRWLANCTMLEVLDLSSNQLSDIFPSWLGSLPNLKVLILRLNKFHGPIMTSNYKFSKLRIIDLSYNSFTGKLPLEFFQNLNTMKVDNEHHLTYIHAYSIFIIPNNSWYEWYDDYSYSMIMTNKGIDTMYAKVQELFTAIDFSNNRFAGVILESIGNLKGLHLLDLSSNVFIGHIPPSFKNLVNLESLDLSQNKLSGEIPQQLAQLTFLEFFNVSYNGLTGPIPQGKQFNTFENNSFKGNFELCGKPLSKNCGNQDASLPPPSTFEESQDSRSPFEFGWKIVLIGYAFGFVFGVIIGHIVITKKHDWFMKTIRIQRKVNGMRRRN